MHIINKYKESMPSNYKLAIWGDYQVGNEATNYKTIDVFNNKIRNSKKTYVILGGDMAESIHIGDKRFEISAHGREAKRSLAQEQRDWVISLCEPIKDRILWMLRGNHEDRIINTYGDLIADVVKGLGLPSVCNGGYVCRADLGAFKVFNWHGEGSPPRGFAGDFRQAQMNKEIWLKRRLRNKASDCELMVMHHIHQVIIHPPVEKLAIIEESGKLHARYVSGGSIPSGKSNIIPEDNRWYAASGTALKTFGDGWETYAEKKGLDPTDLAYVEVEVRNDKIIDVRKVSL